MTTSFRTALAFIALLACAPAALADVRLPAVLSDHMVLQRAARVPVWGWAMPGEAVEVRFAGQAHATHAGTDGRWRVDLDLAGTAADGKSQRLEVNGARNRIVVEDVLVGEAWLASGQSNMQKPLGEQHGQKPTFDADAEIATADHPDIRLFKVERARAATPGDDVQGHAAVLSFDHAAGLAARDGQALTWFEIAGADGVCHPATARVRGEQVVVGSADVPAPRAVRFAWHEAAQPNLVNGAGLPALPFRSGHPVPGNDLSR